MTQRHMQPLTQGDFSFFGKNLSVPAGNRPTTRLYHRLPDRSSFSFAGRGGVAMYLR